MGIPPKGFWDGTMSRRGWPVKVNGVDTYSFNGPNFETKAKKQHCNNWIDCSQTILY